MPTDRLLSSEVPRLELEVPLRKGPHIKALSWHHVLQVLVRERLEYGSLPCIVEAQDAHADVSSS